MAFAIALGCAGAGVDDDPDHTGMSEDDFSAMGGGDDHYLRDVVVRDSFNNTFLLHWPKRKMPLAVYLPPPPTDLFENPVEVFAAVREGVLDWSDVVSPGVPSFEFVEDQGDADIPVVWAAEPDGDWYIARCAYEVNLRQLRFGVSHILVTGRWGDDRLAELDEIYDVVHDEMGHALGLMGHSPSPLDLMYPAANAARKSGLSAADRNTLRALYEHGSRPYRGRRGRRLLAAGLTPSVPALSGPMQPYRCGCTKWMAVHGGLGRNTSLVVHQARLSLARGMHLYYTGHAEERGPLRGGRDDTG